MKRRYFFASLFGLALRKPKSRATLLELSEIERKLLYWQMNRSGILAIHKLLELMPPPKPFWEYRT